MTRLALRDNATGGVLRRHRPTAVCCPGACCYVMLSLKMCFDNATSGVHSIILHQFRTDAVQCSLHFAVGLATASGQL